MEKKPHPKMLLIVTKRKAPNFKPAKCKGRKRGGNTSLNNRKGGHRSNNVKGHMTNTWKNKYWKHVAIAIAKWNDNNNLKKSNNAKRTTTVKRKTTSMWRKLVMAWWETIMVKRSNNKHQFEAKREANDNTKKMVPKNEPLFLQHIRFEATTSNLQTWIFKRKTLIRNLIFGSGQRIHIMPKFHPLWYLDWNSDITCLNFITLRFNN